MKKKKQQYFLSFSGGPEHRIVALSNITADKLFFNIEEVKQTSNFKVLSSLPDIDVTELHGLHIDIQSAMPRLKEELKLSKISYIIGVKNSVNTIATFICADKQVILPLEIVTIVVTGPRLLYIDTPTDLPNTYRLNISVNLLKELDALGYISIDLQS